MEDALLILVVEDEQLIRELLTNVLEEDGYSLILAEDGEQAVKLLDKHKKDIRGLVTDIKLGGKHDLTGWDVARHARELRPEIAVVYLSADSSVDWSAQGVPNSVMISKPFVMAQVSTALATLLNESG